MKETDPRPDSVEKHAGEIRGKHTEAFDDISATKRLERGEAVDARMDQAREAMESRRIIAEGVNRDLHKKYDKYLPPEKRNLNIADRTRFMKPEEFRERLRQKDPSLTEAEIRAIHGFHDGKEQEIAINMEASKSHTHQVEGHEGTHMMADRGFRARYGERLNEGITEHYSRDATRPVEAHDLDFQFDKRGRQLKAMKDVTPHYYEEEVRAAGMVNQHSRVGGEGTMEKAYFRGGKHVDSLSEAVDRSTGEKGTLDRASRHLEEAHRYRKEKQWDKADEEYKKCFGLLEKRGEPA